MNTDRAYGFRVRSPRFARIAPRNDRRASSQSPAVERDEALPVPFRRRLVVAPALRKGEAVMDARIELDLAGHAGFFEQPAKLLHHRQRREVIVLGAGDVELALGPAQ